ncbi:prefoldin subunit beta [Thermoplasmatales archaeon ex4572_165]|nr:MAG: prefoldin subunit beta [Thermoplasmatales archaeon ex4572_165]RLF59164.1 MAG: prefoldin subunit beta [Thermoplasmata archaeon]
MAEDEMSKQVQDQLTRLQQLQSQYQVIQQQRQQVEVRLKEVEDALEELENVKEKTPIYKSIGSLLIKAEGKKQVTEELESTKESLDVRKNSLHKQEGRTREKLTEIQSKVQNAMKISNVGNA